MVNHPTPPWVFLLYASVPLGAIVAAGRRLVLVYRLRRVGVTALGQVVHQQRGGGYQVLTVHFATQRGQTIEGKNAQTDRNPWCFDGDEITLVYDPDRPARFLLPDQLVVSRCYWAIALGLVLVIILALCGYIAYLPKF